MCSTAPRIFVPMTRNCWRWKRIETMVYFELYDQPPAADGFEYDWGLLDWQGRRKPAFSAFANG